MKRVIVLARTFLDTPVVKVADSGIGEALLQSISDEFAGEITVDYRCERPTADRLSPDEFADAVAVIADLERYEADFIKRVGVRNGGSLELIARYGVGLDTVDIPAATEAGVLVSNTPRANSTPTAEWAVATLLDIAGRRMPNHALASTGQRKGPIPRLDVSGKTLGVIGTGVIGRTVIRLLSGFGLRVLGFDLYPDEAWAAEQGITYADLETVLEESDLVTLHASASTRIIGREEIQRMRRASVLVNCARGSLVDNRAAYQAVVDGHLWGYGLDEVWTESDLSLDGLNIAVSPHVGSDTDAGKAGMARLSAQAVVDYLHGKLPEHALNADALERRGPGSRHISK